jgi:hypothetical protein
MKFFEKYLREKVSKAETPLNTLDLWRTIERKRKKRRRLLFFWWSFGAVVGLSGLGFAAYQWKENKNLAAPKTVERSAAFVTEKENNIDVKNKTNNSLSNSYMDKKQVETISSNVIFDKKKDEIQVKNLVEKTVKNSQINKISEVQKAVERENVATENQAIFIQKNKEENININEEKAAIIDNINQEKQVVLSKEKLENMELLPMLSLSLLEETADKKEVLSFVPLLKKPTTKYNNELLFAIGAGLVNRNVAKNPDVKQVGTVKGVVAWNGNVSFRHHFDNQYFIETGVQFNRIINTLSYNKTSKTTLFFPDSLKRIAINNTTNEPYIAKDTFKVFRTTQRQVFYYQYFTNINLLIGGGKTWTKNRFKYQLGANAALLIYQKNKGIYLNENAVSEKIETANQTNVSVMLYGQANYQLSRTNQFFAKISYWQYLKPLENDTKYGIPFLAMGYVKRF